MTAKQLYDLTSPLFAKHPSACPPCLEFIQWQNGEGVWMRNRRDDHADEDAALIIQGHLAQWLAEKHEVITFKTAWAWQVTIDRPNRTFERYGLLESLIAAAMEVPQ